MSETKEITKQAIVSLINESELKMLWRSDISNKLGLSTIETQNYLKELVDEKRVRENWRTDSLGPPTYRPARKKTK